MLYEPTIVLIIVLVALTFVVPRRYFLVPYLITACFVPTDQRIILMGLDFTILRILVLAGIVRIQLYNEQQCIKWNKLDKILFAWVFMGSFIYVLQWLNLKAIINRSGFIFDAIGLYWLFRQKITSWEDIKLVVMVLAFCLICLVPLIAIEWSTGQNPFVVLGRVTTNVRAERYRCQAAFPHSIMFGLFCVTLVPVFVGMAVTQRKIIYWIAAGAAIFAIMASASSTPLVVLAVVCCGIFFFRWRKYTLKIGLFLAVSLMLLHMIMQAPVWHLLARINVIGSSTGWHRYNLIDNAISHFDEWFFLGCRSTEHWGFGLEDVTNQYILEGVRGGIITLLIFLFLISRVLVALLSLSLCEKDRKQQFLVWCIFVMVAAHCAAFLGVSYFGQITMLWYMTLAIAALLANYEYFLAKINHRTVLTDFSITGHTVIANP